MSSSPLAKPAGNAPPMRLNAEMELVLSQPATIVNRAYCVGGVDGTIRLVFGEQFDDRKFFPRSAVVLGRDAALQLADLIAKTVKP